MGLLYDYHVILTLGFVKSSRGYMKRHIRNPAFLF